MRSKKLTAMTLFALSALAGAGAAAATCETYWLPLDGTGMEAHFELPGRWPLVQFVRAEPLLNGYEAFRRRIAPPELRWQPRATLASLTPVGELGGHRVYWVDYGAAKTLVWEDGDWSFCPLLLLGPITGEIAGLHGPEIFSWKGRDFLELRYFVKGMGALQESIFFTAVDGSPIHLRYDEHAIRRWAEDNGIQVYHRDGGFCQGTLSWTNWAWKVDASPEDPPMDLWVEHAVAGKRLVIESARLVLRSGTRDCEIDPGRSRSSRIR